MSARWPALALVHEVVAPVARHQPHVVVLRLRDERLGANFLRTGDAVNEDPVCTENWIRLDARQRLGNPAT